MTNPDELTELRGDINRLLVQARALSMRLDLIEARGQSEEKATPALASPGPPPAESYAPEKKPAAVLPRTPSAIPRASRPAGPRPPLQKPATDWLDAWRDIPPFNYVAERIGRMKEKTRELGWEVALTTYWLPRVSVVCTAIALVFFLTYAMDRWGDRPWAPYFRIGVGYALCMGLFVLAARLERQYAAFARVLYAGAFALTYFVTFATHYVTFARIFESPAPTLVLLSGAVVAWGVVAQRRRSRVVAGLAMVLGHFTVVLATLSVVGPMRFSAPAIVFLSAAAAYFLLANRWYGVAALGAAGAGLNHLLYTVRLDGGSTAEFAVAMTAMAASFVLIAAAELWPRTGATRSAAPTWFRTAFVTLNAGAFFAAGWVLMTRFSFTQPHRELFLFSYSAVLAGFGLAYLRLRDRDPLYNAYFTKATAVLTLGLSTLYSGPSLTAWLAVEMVALLVSARRSGLLVTRLLAIGVGAIALVHGVFTDVFIGAAAYGTEAHTNRMLQGALGVAAFFTASELYRRTDWARRSPERLPFKDDTLASMWRLDLIAAPPDAYSHLRKPLGGLLWAYLYALAGSLLLFCHANALAEPGDRFTALAVFSLITTAGAAGLNSPAFGLASLAVAAAALLTGTAELMAVRDPQTGVIAAGLAAFFAVALGTERFLLPGSEGLAHHRRRVSPYWLYGGAAWLLGLLLNSEFAPQDEVLALLVAGAAAALLYLVLHPKALAWCATGLVAWAALNCVPEALFKGLDGWARPWLLWTVLAAGIAGDRFFAYAKRGDGVKGVNGTLVVLAWLAQFAYFWNGGPSPWFATFTVAASVAFLAYAFAFRCTAAGFLSLVGAAIASVTHVGHAHDQAAFAPGLITGFVATALFWVLCERLLAVFEPQLSKHLGSRELSSNPLAVPGVLAGLATVLLLALAYEAPRLLDADPTLITIGWFVLAAALFVTSLGLKQKVYRYAGLAVIALSLGRVFLVDMKEADTLFKVAAFAVVGLGLLPISFGYFKWMRKLEGGDSSTKEDGAE